MMNTETALPIPAILTLKEAAEVSRFSEATIRHAIQQGALVGSKPTGSDLRILGTDLLKWVSTNRPVIQWDSSKWSPIPLHLIQGMMDNLDDPTDPGNWLDSSKLLYAKVSPDLLQVELCVNATEVPPIGTQLGLPVEGMPWSLPLLVVGTDERWQCPRILCSVRGLEGENAIKIRALLEEAGINWEKMDQYVKDSNATRFHGKELAQILGIDNPTSAHFQGSGHPHGRGARICP
jgi:hypothetical protein